METGRLLAVLAATAPLPLFLWLITRFTDWRAAQVERALAQQSRRGQAQLTGTRRINRSLSYFYAFEHEGRHYRFMLIEGYFRLLGIPSGAPVVEVTYHPVKPSYSKVHGPAAPEGEATMLAHWDMTAKLLTLAFMAFIAAIILLVTHL